MKWRINWASLEDWTEILSLRWRALRSRQHRPRSEPQQMQNMTSVFIRSLYKLADWWLNLKEWLCMHECLIVSRQLQFVFKQRHLKLYFLKLCERATSLEGKATSPGGTLIWEEDRLVSKHKRLVLKDSDQSWRECDQSWRESDQSWRKSD